MKSRTPWLLVPLLILPLNPPVQAAEATLQGLVGSGRYQGEGVFAGTDEALPILGFNYRQPVSDWIGVDTGLRFAWDDYSTQLVLNDEDDTELQLENDLQIFETWLGLSVNPAWGAFRPHLSAGVLVGYTLWDSGQENSQTVVADSSDVVIRIEGDQSDWSVGAYAEAGIAWQPEGPQALSYGLAARWSGQKYQFNQDVDELQWQGVQWFFTVTRPYSW